MSAIPRWRHIVVRSGHALGFAALDAALAGGADGQAGDRTVERQANASEPAAETAADVKEAEMQP